MSWRRHAIAEPMFRTRPCVADIAMTISTCGKSARSSPRRMGTSMGMAANAREDHSSGPPSQWFHRSIPRHAAASAPLPTRAGVSRKAPMDYRDKRSAAIRHGGVWSLCPRDSCARYPLSILLLCCAINLNVLDQAEKTLLSDQAINWEQV